MTDAEFEAQVAHERAIRAARAEAIAIERQTHLATFGISTRRALEASPEGRRLGLIADLARAGMTAAQIQKHFRSLGI